MGAARAAAGVVALGAEWCSSPSTAGHAGALLLADELRRETPRAIRALARRPAWRASCMITGDRAAAAQTIGAALDLDACWPIAFLPTRSMRCAPSSASTRP